MSGLRQELAEPPRDAGEKRRVVRPPVLNVGDIDPLMGAAAVREVATQCLSAIKTVAVYAAQAHQRQRLRHDHLGARAHQRHGDSQEGGELSGRGPRGDDDMIACKRSAARPYTHYAVITRVEPQRTSVLQEPAAAI